MGHNYSTGMNQDNGYYNNDKYKFNNKSMGEHIENMLDEQARLTTGDYFTFTRGGTDKEPQQLPAPAPRPAPPIVRPAPAARVPLPRPAPTVRQPVVTNTPFSNTAAAQRGGGEDKLSVRPDRARYAETPMFSDTKPANVFKGGASGFDLLKHALISDSAGTASEYQMHGGNASATSPITRSQENMEFSATSNAHMGGGCSCNNNQNVSDTTPNPIDYNVLRGGDGETKPAADSSSDDSDDSDSDDSDDSSDNDNNANNKNAQEKDAKKKKKEEEKKKAEESKKMQKRSLYYGMSKQKYKKKKEKMKKARAKERRRLYGADSSSDDLSVSSLSSSSDDLDLDVDSSSSVSSLVSTSSSSNGYVSSIGGAINSVDIDAKYVYSSSTLPQKSKNNAMDGGSTSVSEFYKRYRNRNVVH
jgi:hypothetical protein